MQQSLSVVLERNTVLSGEFVTEPYEVAWAREGRWFVHALETWGTHTRFEAITQVSPDGLHWCDLDEQTQVMNDSGVTTWPVQEFGGWLRLRGTVTDADADPAADRMGVKAIIYLALKS